MEQSYKEKYEQALAHAREIHRNEEEKRRDMEFIFPELKESEDEKIKNRLIKLIKMSNEVGGFALHKWEADEMLTWLEKQGQVKESAISQHENRTCEENDDSLTSEDERIRKEIIHLVKKSNEQGGYALHKDEADNMIAWLEKQGHEPKKIESQPKQEWSEEDESMLDEAIYLIRREPYCEKDIEPIVDWLKSLKGRVQPQNTWKPSDKQMIALRHTISGCSYDIEPLVELETKLKEL